MEEKPCLIPTLNPSLIREGEIKPSLVREGLEKGRLDLFE